jgi:hypothetical protein
MAAVVFDGPLPPEGGIGLWCTLCSMVYKGAALASAQDAIRAAPSQPGDFVHIPLSAPGVMLEEAVTQALVILPVAPGAAMPGSGAQVLTWVCWSHLQGLNPNQNAVLAASAGDMPQGVPAIGQRR